MVYPSHRRAMMNAQDFDTTIATGRSYGFVEFESEDYEVANVMREVRPGEEPNVVTSLVTSTGLHRPVLDVDVQHDIVNSRLRLDIGHIRRSLLPELVKALNSAGIPQRTEPYAQTTYLTIDLSVPYHLVPSSTPGHSHLYLNVDVPWDEYKKLLLVLAHLCVVQRGWVDTAVKHGRSVARLPWIAKS